MHATLSWKPGWVAPITEPECLCYPAAWVAVSSVASGLSWVVTLDNRMVLPYSSVSPVLRALSHGMLGAYCVVSEYRLDGL